MQTVRRMMTPQRVPPGRMPLRCILPVGMILLCASAIACGGCVTYRAIPLDGDDPAHARAFRKEVDGVVIAAQLISGEAEMRAYFFRPLEEHGIVAVVIHIENSGTRTLVLQRESIRLRLESGAEFTTVNPEEVITASRTSSSWAYVGLPLVIPYIYAKDRIDSFNFELDRDYRGKSLPKFLRVAPDDPPTAKALFFELPAEAFEELHRSPIIEVRAQVEALAQGETHEPGKDVQFLLSLD